LIICHAGRTHPSESPNHTRNFWIPPRADAIELLKNYDTKVSHVHNVVYMPFVYTLLDDTYDQLASNQQPLPAHIALLLSILASSVRGVVNSVSDLVEAARSAKMWTRYALELLEYSRQITSPSLEDIQASIIISFLTYNIEGSPVSSHVLWGTTILMARELRLHRVDASGDCTSSQTRNEIIQLEIKRRVWWYLASSDW
jgi:hypothetical protein